MEINTRLITEDEYITTAWSGGKTTQLFIYPEEADYSRRNFKFRLSSATVESEKSEFTKLEGVYRFITPLDGQLKLTHNHIQYIDLQPFEVYEFDGNKDTVSFGKVRDFNLMLRSGAEGKLDSICINKEQLFVEEINGDFKEFFYFIYACSKDVSVDVDGKGYNINQFQTLLIKVESECVLNIKISSMGNADILAAKIYIW
ncbi:HutD family protein [Sedimentibacter hydroxybenzoicus DSM 7310]|uniref:HutD family protein n=1 Tax=Sedimentibacter hydroxybenzoicus DSM 7310 TaxID=1123245 RepID=A0A974BIB9_SEDHY|nr:HutD family protein [Sedimentibacter hydroxybenzoicus]NYB73441.1 HutD family protein [Sedimentibacter hydroxybenzoicus DSM 7310]